MNLHMCSYNDEVDFWRIREFLRRVFVLNAYRSPSWDLVRWDYWRWNVHENIFHFPLEESVFLWEDERGEIGAVLNPDNRGEAFLQVHPALTSPELESEMLALAEERLAQPGPEGHRKLITWASAEDSLRQDLLTKRGYVKGDWPEYQRRRSLDLPIPEARPAPGYTVRALGDSSELPARSWISWKAFHPNEPDECYSGWEWYRNVQRAPLYRRDLDLVAVAPGGELAAFATAWFDDVTRTGVFEPVGTIAAHQQRGLGKALMCEGLRRLKRLGAVRAMVSSYSIPAGALYASAGFTEYDLVDPWIKEW